MTEKLPPEIPDNETLRTMHAQAEEFLLGEKNSESSSSVPSIEFEQQSAPDVKMEGNDDASRVVPCKDEGNILKESNNSSVSNPGVPPPTSENGSRSRDSSIPGEDGERSAIEQFEPGVYITLIALPNGSKIFKRVRFRYKSYLLI